VSLDDVVHGAVGGHRARHAVVAIDRGGGETRVVAVGGDPDELFEIGSITKTMTATLVLQHVARGDLDLDDPVVAHVRDLVLAPAEATASVTVRHLLTHTSGIDCGDDFRDTGGGDDCLARYVAEAINGSRLFHPPGERWSYANGGFTLLGRLVEVLDGRCWDDAMLARILQPLGLSATTTARLGPAEHPVTGHRFDPERGELVDEPGRMPRSAGPAGNVVATATDLVTFARALFAGQEQLLRPELVDEMIRPQIAVRDAQQALAWSSPVPGMVVHGGATRGSTAFLGAVPGVGALAVVADGPGAPAIAMDVQAHLFGSRPNDPGPPPAVEVDPSRFVGTYERRNTTQRISWEDGHLVASQTFHGPNAELFPQQRPVALTPVGDGRFTSQRPGEDFPTAWDFTDPDESGASTFLLTNRLHRRVG
jgi:CubicO group peptidase (beta-lactamase class C family)